MYIYQSDVWCDDCGEAIQNRLISENSAPDDYDNESEFDSDEFPKTVLCGEADTPQHCGAGENCFNAEVLPSGRKIGVLLNTDLTSDGVQYVKDAVAEGGEVADFWKVHFDL